jgi:3-deoxy-manno-octulosonate cytidylyltransferase (CMP-KDO synthetase)
VATDADEVMAAVKAIGGEGVMTSPECASGTDRVADAARKYPGYDLVINVQGDEPEMACEPLQALIAGMKSKPAAEMGTVAVPWPEGVPLDESGFVKLVTDREGCALYFSRSPIPFYRNVPPGGPVYRKHVGLYAYKADFLQKYATMKPTALEMAEGLEQLRALENGHRIAVFDTQYSGYEVNTPEDYDAFVRRNMNR